MNHYCSACGTPIPEGAHFCPKCGHAAMTVSPSTPTIVVSAAGSTAQAAPPRPRGRWLVLAGSLLMWLTAMADWTGYDSRTHTDIGNTRYTDYTSGSASGNSYYPLGGFGIFLVFVCLALWTWLSGRRIGGRRVPRAPRWLPLLAFGYGLWGLVQAFITYAQAQSKDWYIDGGYWSTTMTFTPLFAALCLLILLVGAVRYLLSPAPSRQAEAGVAAGSREPAPAAPAGTDLGRLGRWTVVAASVAFWLFSLPIWVTEDVTDQASRHYGGGHFLILGTFGGAIVFLGLAGWLLVRRDLAPLWAPFAAFAYGMLAFAGIILTAALHHDADHSFTLSGPALIGFLALLVLLAGAAMRMIARWRREGVPVMLRGLIGGRLPLQKA